MTAATNRKWTLRARPQGMIKDSDFSLDVGAIPEPAEGEVLLRTLYLSCDPTQRGWVEDRPGYMPPVQLGEVMRSVGIGQVVASRHPGHKVGELAQGLIGWQEYAVLPGKALQPIEPGLPPTWFLGVLGLTGLTAYFGLLDIGKPVAGETVLVSGAAGATGSIAGQIARIHGCKVIGIAGGQDKCDWLVKEAHFHHAIDYKSEEVGRRIRALCPGGVNVFFDNVGGQILDDALLCLANRARIVLCGGIAGYNDPKAVALKHYLSLIIHRARMEGFVIIDYAPRFREGVSQLATWLNEGKLRHQEDIQEGLENAPATLRRLFEGKNHGKQILKVADPS